MPVELEMEKDLLDLLDGQPMRCDSACSSFSSCPSALVAGLFVPDAWQRCLDQVTVTQPATMQHRHFVSGHGRLARSQTYQKLLIIAYHSVFARPRLDLFVRKFRRRGGETERFDPRI